MKTENILFLISKFGYVFTLTFFPLSYKSQEGIDSIYVFSSTWEVPNETLGFSRDLMYSELMIMLSSWDTVSWAEWANYQQLLLIEKIISYCKKKKTTCVLKKHNIEW